MLLSVIEIFKQKFYSRISEKLMDSGTSPRAYWSLLKTFLINQKIPCIPPLFHNNKLIGNFKDKAELLNDCFAQQYTLNRQCK